MVTTTGRHGKTGHRKGAARRRITTALPTARNGQERVHAPPAPPAQDRVGCKRAERRRVRRSRGHASEGSDHHALLHTHVEQHTLERLTTPRPQLQPPRRTRRRHRPRSERPLRTHTRVPWERSDPPRGGGGNRLAPRSRKNHQKRRADSYRHLTKTPRPRRQHRPTPFPRAAAVTQEIQGAGTTNTQGPIRGRGSLRRRQRADQPHPQPRRAANASLLAQHNAWLSSRRQRRGLRKRLYTPSSKPHRHDAFPRLDPSTATEALFSVKARASGL